MRAFFYAACFLIAGVSYASTEPDKAQTPPEQVAEASADKKANQAAAAKSAFAPAVFKVIEATQLSLDESYEPIESEMADVAKNISKQLLGKPVIFKALLRNAERRYEADKAATEESFDVNHALYAKYAMAALQTSLRQSPGVMTRPELISRARAIADVAKYYDRKDPSMCRYLPQDFTLLLNVDAPWVGEVDQTNLEEAFKGESDAVLRMYEGVYPIIIADVDMQSVFSKFALEWFKGLSEDDKSRIAVSRNSGNYCVLWNIILNDAAKMAETFPRASQKVLLPLLTMPTRGWLDVDKWGFVPPQEQ